MSLTLSTIPPEVDCRKRTNIKGVRTPIPIITFEKNRLILSEDRSLSQEMYCHYHH